MFKITDKTVRNWIRNGELDAIVVGKTYRIPEESIKTLIKRNEVKSNE
uniref:Helix-turn-helix domain protein n=1 Tax=Tectiviridae sp. cthzn51 TaxID=2826821 RepID=A0A8S5LUA2_9VIRU|nr:MAG TPA: helix-turn-helix domain protein [Tectiviridae sp. cthzn51]